MYKLTLFFSILILSANTIAYADQDEQVITLKDGSQIKGELSGIVDGVYTVKTPIIGDVHVAARDVASITNNAINGTVAPTASVAPNPGSALNLDETIAASQKKLMSNPQSMATLQEMAQDPDIMKALSDPALVQAVTSHNFEAVQNNPQIQELLNSPKMQAYLQKLAAQQQQQNTSSQ